MQAGARASPASPGARVSGPTRDVERGEGRVGHVMLSTRARIHRRSHSIGGHRPVRVACARARQLTAHCCLIDHLCAIGGGAPRNHHHHHCDEVTFGMPCRACQPRPRAASPGCCCGGGVSCCGPRPQASPCGLLPARRQGSSSGRACRGPAACTSQGGRASLGREERGWA